jgi:hypothetical protein
MADSAQHRADTDSEEELVRAHLALARLQKAGGALIDWALVYAGLGYPIFPCSPATKRPLTKHGFKEATTDASKIKAIWKRSPKAAIGMRTGAASGLLVVDIDAKSEQQALMLVEELRKQIGGKLPACWMVTTPRGGLHLYFAVPAGAKLGCRVAMIATEAGQVDVRGDGGYVILPPSRRFGAQASKEGCDGVAYAWSEECGIGDIDPPETPQGLVDLITRKDAPAADTAPRPRSPKPAPRTAGELADRRKQAVALKAFNDEIRGLESAAKGGRNSRLNIVAMKLGQFVAAGLLSQSMVESALEAACHTNGLAKDDSVKAVRATIASGLRFGLTQPRDLSHIDGDVARQDMRSNSPARRAEPSGLSAVPVSPASSPPGHRKPPEGPEAPTGEDRRPVIRFQPSLMHEAVDRAEKILLQAGPGPIYQHNGQLVHITHMPVLRFDGTEEQQQAIGFVEKAFFTRTVSQRARCERYLMRDGAWIPCNPKPEMADQYFALKQWRLPILRQIISAPLVRPDGSLLDRQGYDARTGLYLTHQMEGLSVPERPTEDQAVRALETITELFNGYPLVDEPGREGVSLAVLVAGLLTSVQRAVLDFAPLFGITAPKAGTGKSHAVDVVSVIATGARADCVIAGSDPEEFKKTLGSKLCEGRPLFSLDNVPEGVPLQGQYLCTALTQDYVEHRVLGFGIMAKPSTCVTMFATGNNLTVRGDMTRRTLMCRMDAKMERPEQRTFEHDLRDEALRRRAELISAVLTIVRWRHSWREDAPDPWERAADAMPLAGYQKWCRLIRDPLVALGLKDPVLSVEDVRATDDQEEGLSTLLQHWYAAFHETPKTSRAVYEGMAGHAALIDAVRTVTRDLELKDPGKLGKYVAKFLGTRCNSLRFERGHKSYGNQTWMVVKEK